MRRTEQCVCTSFTSNRNRAMTWTRCSAPVATGPYVEKSGIAAAGILLHKVKVHPVDTHVPMPAAFETTGDDSDVPVQTREPEDDHTTVLAQAATVTATPLPPVHPPR
jgi:hypothetical protein